MYSLLIYIFLQRTCPRALTTTCVGDKAQLVDCNCQTDTQFINLRGIRIRSKNIRQGYLVARLLRQG